MSEVNDHTREQLLGYLLGALDEPERDELERQLEAHPQWQEELESLVASLEPLADSYVEYQPPPELAARVCAAVSRECQVTAVNWPRSAPSGRSQWSIADVIVMAGICLASAFLFFPAISQSRLEARLHACQHNLRELGFALLDYSEKAGRGYFPSVPSEGKRAFAGNYGPELCDAGYEVRPYILCPDSALAREGGDFVMPKVAELEQASGPGLANLQRLAGGSYAYNLGSVVHGRHCAPRNQGRSHFVLMADAPAQWNAKPRRLEAHDGGGQNLLYEDGRVRFVKAAEAAGRFEDDPFLNRLGLVEAGVDADDSVVAPSSTPPFSGKIIYLDQ